MLRRPILLALLASFLAAAAHAQTLVLMPDDRFCLVRESEPILSGCRAEQFPGQFYYTAYCPDPTDPDAPERRSLITDPASVVMEGEPNCPRLITRASDVVFEPLGYRSERAPDPTEAGAPPTEHVVRVLFGTNRAITQNEGQISFTGERDRQLHLGSVAVSIPANHDRGKVERPWSFRVPLTRLTIGFKEDPNNHFAIRWMEQLSLKLFVDQLRDAMAYEDDSLKQAFVFIHGYNVSFEDAAFRTAQIVQDMEFDGAPIFYSWPSRGQVEDYPYDKESNLLARDYLEEFLRLVREESRADIIHLIAHSMGNDALLEALRDLNRRDDRTKPLFGEVVLAAPDVAFDDFLDRAKDIEGAADGYTLYANEDDRALTASRHFWGGIRRAGDLPPVIMPGIDTIDITAIGSSLLSLNHSEYADNPALLTDIEQLFQNHPRPPSKRNPQIRQEGMAPDIYWRFVRQ